MTKWLLEPAALAVTGSLACAAWSRGDAIELDRGRDQVARRYGGVG